MRPYLFKGGTAFILAVFLMTFTAVPALAADVRTGDTVVVADGEVVNGDLFITGGDVTINGTVNGDIIGFARSITINGTVNGSITAAGQDVRVNGKVERGARLAGATVSVGGSVGRDLVAAGGTIALTSGGKVGNDVMVAGGTLNIDGQVAGNVKGSGGTIMINDGIGGYVSVNTDRLTITSKASIKGDVTYTGDNEATVQPGATISGKMTHNIPKAKEAATVSIFTGIMAALVGKVIGFLMIFVIGLIIILLMPRRITAMVKAICTGPWQSLGWGALILFVTPIACIILLITVIGLPIGLILAVFYGIAIYLSEIPVALLIGKLILNRKGDFESRSVMIGAFALGLFILLLLKWIPIIGFIVGLLTVVFGLGCLITAHVRVHAEPRV